MTRHKKRLEDLARKINTTEKPVGVYRGDDQGVIIQGTRERMTLEEWENRYPEGYLIRVVREGRAIPMPE
jgi:hypothetical protein